MAGGCRAPCLQRSIRWQSLCRGRSSGHDGVTDHALSRKSSSLASGPPIDMSRAKPLARACWAATERVLTFLLLATVGRAAGALAAGFAAGFLKLALLPAPSTLKKAIEA